MHIFIGCYVYVVDFMILEDLGSIIDSGLSEVVLGKPFVHTSKLTYDRSLGLMRFSQRDKEVVFRMPQRTKELDLVSSLEKDKFEALFVEILKVRKKGFKHVLEKRRGYYKACMNLGRRKAHLLENKQIPSVGIFDEVFSTWMAFGGNTRDLGSFREETDEILDLHQIHEEILFLERGDGVIGIKRRRRDPSSDGARDLVTALGRGRLNEDLESST
ncbi:hypothetical protein Tco_0803189 [Tanacetum coccineum]|uniref:Uncharacterized protein n=1 Tax=Tanacetum coccineum TaxID=301880 RepID=A0ABQ5A3D6_9ASTR